MVKEPDHLFLVAFAALSVIANYVMPQMLEVIKASNWDVRVTLAAAARNAWAARVNDIRRHATSPKRE
jgi:purine-cytosine permease-like protein